MRLRIGLLLLLCLSLSACSNPQPPEPETRPASAVLKRKVFRQIADIQGNVEVTGGKPIVIGPDGVVITWELNGEPAALKVASSGPQPDSVNLAANYLQARFYRLPEGTFDVWLEGLADSRLTLKTLHAAPKVQFGYLDKAGTVVPITGDTALPSGPVTLDFAFDQPMHEKTLERAALAMWGRAPVPGTLEWLTPEHARWSLPELPYGLSLRSEAFYGENGLQAQHAYVTVRNVAGFPYLERIRTTDRKTERLADLPPDIWEAELSPNARRIAVRTTLFQAHVADLTERKVTQVPTPAWSLGWAPDGDLLLFGAQPGETHPYWSRWSPATGTVTRAKPAMESSPVFSPNGQKAAYLRANPQPGSQPGPVDMDRSFPTDLILLDLATGQEQVVSVGFVRTWYFGKEGDFRQWPVWSPDGTRIAALDPIQRGADADLVMYDAATGERRVVRSALAASAFGTRLTWSPDGAHIGAGKWIIPLDNSPVTELPGYNSRVYWDTSGHWVLASEGWWGDTAFVYNLTTGQKIDLGPGRPVGWVGDWVYIIRWPGHQFQTPSGL